MIKEDKIRYCSHCGAKMIVRKAPAETKDLFCYGTDIVKEPIGAPYDRKTGKRQYVREYICPNYGKREKWVFTLDKHDKYFDHEIIY